MVEEARVVIIGEKMNDKFFIVVFILLASCCSGDKFKHVELKEGESVVYFYRPNCVGCVWPVHRIMDKDTENCIAVVPAGGYYPHVAYRIVVGYCHHLPLFAELACDVDSAGGDPRLADFDIYALPAVGLLAQCGIATRHGLSHRIGRR